MLKSISKQIQDNEDVVTLELLREQVKALENNKEVLNQKERKNLREEARKVVRVLDSYIDSVVELRGRIHYLLRAPAMKSFSELYQELKLRDHKIKLVYSESIDLYAAASWLVYDFTEEE